MFGEITRKLSFVFQCLLPIYFIVTLYYFMSISAGVGDEFLFLSDLKKINELGWYEAIVQNISIPYMLLVYPMSFIFKDYVALRLVNIALVLVLFFYFYHVAKIRIKEFYFYCLFFIGTVGYFYFGTNDCLFFVSLIIFFTEVYSSLNKRVINFNLALTTLVIAFFTRELFLVYVPIILLGIYILFHSKYKLTSKTFVPLCVVLLFLFLNLPSLEHNGSLSFDKKSPPQENGVSWSQRQYLGQLQVNNGTLPSGQHPSWEETEDYLQINGSNSLPDGILEGITFDVQLTIEEFFKDFGQSIILSIRSLCLMLLITLLYWFIAIYTTQKFDLNYFVPMATFAMLLIFSFIIISNVELRWLSAVFMLTIVYYSELENKNKISKYLIAMNYGLLCLLSIYGIFRVFYKL